MDTVYRIELIRSTENEPSKIWVDGEVTGTEFIALVNDDVDHEVNVFFQQDTHHPVSQVDKEKLALPQ